MTAELLRGKWAKLGVKGHHSEGVQKEEMARASLGHGSQLCAVARKDTHLGLRVQGSWWP